MLGVTIDSRLSFIEHVHKICDKANQKLNALARLIWMFHNRILNDKINRIHKRALRIVYRDKTSNFTELLQKDNATAVHQRNLQVLATEVYEVKIGLDPQVVKELFPLSTHACNLRSTYEFKLENVKTVHYGTESLLFLGPKTWELVLLEIKSSHSLEEFKKKIKSWISIQAL